MKKIKLSIMAMLLLGAVACKKTDNTSGNVTNAEAAEMVAGSISYSSSGFGSISDDATSTASSPTALHLTCGSTIIDTIARHSTTTVSPYAYNYKLIYSYMLNCNTNNQPFSLVSNLTYSGFFSSPNFTLTNSGTSTFTVSGLSPTANSYVIDGEYKSGGTFKSKTDSTKTGTNNIDVVVKALTFTKPARTIASGTATISVTGNVPKKGNFSFTGTLVFNSDGTATLTLNGTAYVINLATGIWTKV